jgi:hypothetical protein
MGATGRGQPGGNLEHVLCVFGRPHTAGQDKVVTGVFAFDVQPPCSEPNERVEPVQRAGNLHEPLGRQIAALDVRQFVKEHRTELAIVPLQSLCWQHQARAEKAPDHRDSSLRIEQQLDGPTDIELSPRRAVLDSRQYAAMSRRKSNVKPAAQARGSQSRRVRDFSGSAGGSAKAGPVGAIVGALSVDWWAGVVGSAITSTGDMAGAAAMAGHRGKTRQSGSNAESSGSTSNAPAANNQTRCRVAADALNSASAATPARTSSATPFSAVSIKSGRAVPSRRAREMARRFI